MERLQAALNQHSEERFLLFYGSGLGDTFVTPDYLELDFEQALTRLLLAQGYQRVVFVSPAEQGVYFCDPDSHRRAHVTPETSTEQGQNKTASAFQGPMGGRMVVTLPGTDQPPSPLGRPETGMSDTYIVGLIDFLMQDSKGPRTAIVIQQAETSIQFFQNQRTLAGRIGKWHRLPSTNRNVCIWLFMVARQRDMDEVIRSIPIPELRFYSEASVQIASPMLEEMDRLVDYARLRYGMSLNWKERRRLVPQLETARTLARIWLSRLHNLPAPQHLDRMTSLRKGWISGASDGRSAEEQLQSMVGLKGVKAAIAKQKAVQARIVRRLKSGNWKTHPTDTPHLVFTGNPGTGKTEVARLVGEIYRDIGRLRLGHLVEKNAAELISDVVGGTVIKTNEAINEALDGVLFIDEAYQLAETERGGHGKEVIEMLLTRMENERERLVVIVAGYPSKMSRFLESNNGLASRFPQRNVIHFEDYSPDELQLILNIKLDELDLHHDSVQEILCQLVTGIHASRDDNFGNGRVMRELAEEIFAQHSVRIEEAHLPDTTPLDLDDVPDRLCGYLNKQVPTIDSLMAELDTLVGLETVKEFVRDQVALIAQDIEDGASPSVQSLHMVFTGNPGTGKTTVARLMGRILKELGLLHKGHTVETKRGGLVGRYVGDTEHITEQKIKEALDGVLFIDEAYALVQEHEGGYGKTAINELVTALENYRDRLVVIVAGYTEEMQTFIQSNVGLPSRFTKFVEFPDYSVEEMVTILTRALQKDGFSLTAAAEVSVSQYLISKKLTDGHTFANARAVRNLMQDMKVLRARRLQQESKQVTPSTKVFEASDVPKNKGL